MSFPTGATLGIGTLVEFETVEGAFPLAFTTLAEPLDLPPLQHTREQVEATNQQSQGYTREYIPGLIDAEEYSFECNYIPDDTSQEACWTMFSSADGGARLWRIRETTTSPEKTMTFRASISAIGYGFPVAEKKVLQITLRRSGPSTRA